MAVVVESSINALRKMLAMRDDVPVGFQTTTGKQPKAKFVEHKENWVHQTWQTVRDNGGLYPSDESYAPYLEIV